MLPENFIKSSSRPSFITTGFKLLIEPSFILANTTTLVFYWEIKCVKELPPLSIKVKAVTHSPQGKKAENLSRHFIIPDGQTFLEQKALPKKMCACLQTHCTIKVKNTKEIPLGKFRLVIQMSFWGQTHEIYQYFKLQK